MPRLSKYLSDKGLARKRALLVQRRAKWKLRYLNVKPHPSEAVAFYNRALLHGRRIHQEGKELGMKGWWLEEVKQDYKLLAIKWAVALPVMGEEEEER